MSDTASIENVQHRAARVILWCFQTIYVGASKQYLRRPLLMIWV